MAIFNKTDVTRIIEGSSSSPETWNQIFDQIETNIGGLQQAYNNHQSDRANPHNVQANQVPYSNLNSTLLSSNVKTAIDELDTKSVQNATPDAINGRAVLRDSTTGRASIADPVDALNISNKKYVDEQIAANEIDPNLLIPTGSVLWFTDTTIPTGFLSANGATISRTTYVDLFAIIGTTFGAGDGSTTFNIPDLRGEFIRGFDDGRGIDSGRVFGSWQADELKSHTHDYAGAGYSTDKAPDDGPQWEISSPTTRTSAPTGGSETRPRNVALIACIKY